MKKSLILYACTIALFFGCSADEPLTQDFVLPDDPMDVPEGLVIENGPVPIEFSIGTGRLETRSPGSVDAGDMNCKDLGVFCLSRKPINGSSLGVRWDQTGNPLANLARVWINNAKARMKSKNGGGAELLWDDGVKEHFYPASNSTYDFAYGFAVYHPLTDTLRYGIHLISGVFEIDGNTDIFSGVVGAPAVSGTGFSTDYYRVEGGTVKPSVTIKHRLTKLNIKIRLENASSNSKGFVVDSVWIPDMPSVLVIPLVQFNSTTMDVENPTYSTAISTSSDNFRTLTLREHDGTSIRDNSYQVTNQYPALPIGDGIMIPPINPTTITNSSKYNLYSTFKVYTRLIDADGGVYTFKTTIPPPNNGGQGWLEGSEYPINIVVNPTTPTDIGIASSASMMNWDNGSSYVDSEFNGTE